MCVCVVRFRSASGKHSPSPFALKTPLFLLPEQLLNELSNMQLSVSQQQEGSQRLQQEMRRQLQEKEQTIRAQREQVGTRSLAAAAAAAA